MVVNGMAALEEFIEHVVRRVLAERQREVPAELSPPLADVLTQAEAAVVAHVSVSTIREWQGKGYLPKGHQGRVERSALMRFLAEGPPTKSDETSADAKAAAILARKRGGRRG